MHFWNSASPLPPTPPAVFIFVYEPPVIRVAPHAPTVDALGPTTTPGIHGGEKSSESGHGSTSDEGIMSEGGLALTSQACTECQDCPGLADAQTLTACVCARALSGACCVEPARVRQCQRAAAIQQQAKKENGRVAILQQLTSGVRPTAAVRFRHQPLVYHGVVA